MATLRKLYSSSRQYHHRVNTSNGNAFARSDGCTVIGIDPHLASNGVDRWKTKFNDEISSIVSTFDGSIIAVTTVDQALSLVKGCNGGVLATRSVKPRLSGEGKKNIVQG